MNGKEAKEILNCVLDIYDHLNGGDEKNAFYVLGYLSNKLQNIIDIDLVSFNPTIKNIKNEEN